jgi:Rrf2 family transcriptional regulator, cysteine metabolism repressor
MKMSTKGKYALTTMSELAEAYKLGTKYLQSKDISYKHAMPQQYVEQILNKLKRAGLVKALRGRNGGYYLSRSPKTVTIGEIINATEGPVMLAQCVTKTCSLSSKCKTKNFWGKLSNAIEGLLDKTTLADIC